MLHRATESGLPQSGKPAWWQGIQTPYAKLLVIVSISGTKNGTPFGATVDRLLPYVGGRGDQTKIEEAPYETFTAPDVPGPWPTGLDEEWAYCYRYRIPVFRSSLAQCEYPYAIVLAPADPFLCGSLVDLNACGFALKANEIANLTASIGSFGFDDFFSDPENGTWLRCVGDELRMYVPLKSLLPDEHWFVHDGDWYTCCTDPPYIPHSEAVWRPGGDGFLVDRHLEWSEGGVDWVLDISASLVAVCWHRANEPECGCQRSPVEWNHRFIDFHGELRIPVGAPVESGCDDCQFLPPIPFGGRMTWDCVVPPYGGVYLDLSRNRGYRCLLESDTMSLPLTATLCSPPPPPPAEPGPCSGCLDAELLGEPSTITAADIGVLPCPFSPGAFWPHAWLPNGYVEVGVSAHYQNLACLVAWVIGGTGRYFFRWDTTTCDGSIDGHYELYDDWGRNVGAITIGA